jgi:hypothetical protein
MRRTKLTKHDITIGIYFAYGWMPRMLSKFDISNINKIVNILNRAKRGIFPQENELEILRDSINNSLVGVSKLLHFINPDIFAIWDSNVYKYIQKKGKAPQCKFQSIRHYLDYHKKLNQLIKQKGFSSVHKSINKKIGYNVSAMRACEYIMYLSQRSKDKHR